MSARPAIRLSLLLQQGIIVSLTLLLGACATRPPLTITGQEREAAWQTRQKHNASLDTWRLRGRLSLRMSNEGWSAGLIWDQDRHLYNIRVVAPLGQGTIELAGDRDAVVMHTADNRTLHADNPEALLQEQLHWDIPVSGLLYWIRGLPYPPVTVDKLVLDDQGRLQYLEQAGWQIDIERYVPVDGFELPQKLNLERDSVRLRIAVGSWGINP